MDTKRFDGPPVDDPLQFDARRFPLSEGEVAQSAGGEGADMSETQPELKEAEGKVEQSDRLDNHGEIGGGGGDQPRQARDRKRGRRGKPRQPTPEPSAREQTTVETAPTKPGRPSRAEADAIAETKARRRRIEAQLKQLEVAEEAYEEAKDELTKRVRELRSRVRRRELTGENLKRETERMVSSFKETQAGAVLKKLLPDRVGATSFSDKLRRTVELALDLSYWSEPGFNQRYRKKFGSEVVDDFDEQERSLMNDLLDATTDEEVKAETTIPRA
ncbi:MAG: hypothetical protein HY567_04370 [Candidatus Kerfeldbacteria bacterium]|nr:hypothetical protein [Candidatus Kerfeldbacteria bacterium]